MFIELCLTRDYNIGDILRSKFYYRINSISIAAGQMSSFPDPNKDLTALIDYPYGLNNTKIREHEIIYAIRSGAKKIDLTLNSVLVNDGKIDNILTDLSACNAICKQHNIQLRPIIEYRTLSPFLVIDLCVSISLRGIDCIINSTGTITDDINDNLIISHQIKSKTSLQVIPCTNFCTPDKFKSYNDMGLTSIRLMSVSAIENLFK